MKPLNYEGGPEEDWVRGNHAILLDRTRRDLLAYVNPDAIEAFDYHYLEVKRLNRLKPGLGDDIQEWVDNYLILSASRNGWRGEQVTGVLKGRDDADPDGAKDLEVTGLKHG